MTETDRRFREAAENRLRRLRQSAERGTNGAAEIEAINQIAEDAGMPWREGCQSYHYDTAPCHVCNPPALTIEAELLAALEESLALNSNWVSDAEPETLAYYSEYKTVIAQAKAAIARAKAGAK